MSHTRGQSALLWLKLWTLHSTEDTCALTLVSNSQEFVLVHCVLQADTLLLWIRAEMTKLYKAVTFMLTNGLKENMIIIWINWLYLYKGSFSSIHLGKREMYILSTDSDTTLLQSPSLPTIACSMIRSRRVGFTFNITCCLWKMIMSTFCCIFILCFPISPVLCYKLQSVSTVNSATNVSSVKAT